MLVPSIHTCIHTCSSLPLPFPSTVSSCTITHSLTPNSYTKIISGKINYPDGMFSAVSEDLVSRLCTKVPSKRLGNMKGGIMDVKKHKFFGPFNWMVR